MAKNIDTKLNSIQNLFMNGQEKILGTDGKFYIPEYQRAYNWKDTEQCDKLWQDIEAFVENKRNEAYFFGSIIINSENDKLYLIDGQQRVTTFLLLLKAILMEINEKLKKIGFDEESRKLRQGLEQRQKAIIQCLYLIDEDDVYTVIEGTKKYSELAIKYENKSINEEYKTELESILKGENYQDIEQKTKRIPYKQKKNKYTNFYRNFLFFCEKLRQMDSVSINTFTKELLGKCQVIVVISYQTEESIEIFNSLNSTGMPLADADIISAKLYTNFKDDVVPFKKDWSEIIQKTNQLASRKIVSIDDILNQYMYILRAKRGEKDTTLPAVRRYFTSINEDAINAPQTFIEDMKTIVNFWFEEQTEIRNENDEIDIEQTKQLREINTLKQILFRNNSNFRFYLATYLFFYQKNSLFDKLAFVKALLKLFSILSISEVGYSSSKFKQFLIDLNMKMGIGYKSEEIVTLLNNHIATSFSKDEIIKSLKENDANIGLVYLNEYLFAKEQGVDLDLSVANIEIEHIMPASGKNIVAIREDAKMDEEEFSAWVNKIGNKILLEKNINGSISNDWFRVKKQKSVKNKQGYRDSIFPLAISLTAYPKNVWEKIDIEYATEKAAKRIGYFLFS